MILLVSGWSVWMDIVSIHLNIEVILWIVVWCSTFLLLFQENGYIFQLLQLDWRNVCFHLNQSIFFHGGIANEISSILSFHAPLNTVILWKWLKEMVGFCRMPMMENCSCSFHGERSDPESFWLALLATSHTNLAFHSYGAGGILSH